MKAGRTASRGGPSGDGRPGRSTGSKAGEGGRRSEVPGGRAPRGAGGARDHGVVRHPVGTVHVRNRRFLPRRTGPGGASLGAGRRGPDATGPRAAGGGPGDREGGRPGGEAPRVTGGER